MDANDISDALRAPMPSQEALTLQILSQIRDSLSAINRKQDKIGEDVATINIRVVKLEEQDGRLKRLEEGATAQDAKITALLREKDQRDGASGVIVGVRGWMPVIIAIGAALASIFSAIYLAGRATGVISPSAATRHEVQAIDATRSSAPPDTSVR